MLSVHYFQHVAFEGLGSIEPYLLARGHALSGTHWYRGDPLPDMQAVDVLMVMGGPMGIHDHADYAWLLSEKKLIKEAIDAGKTVLGVCLGAQLIADVLGARVYRNAHKEIGWFDVQASPAFELTKFALALPSRFEAFHWHGDTFQIPKNAVALGCSEACGHQGFVFDHRVVGLQFHLETTHESAMALIEHCGHELDGSTYVQSAAKMLEDKERFMRLNQHIVKLLQILGC